MGSYMAMARRCPLPGTNGGSQGSAQQGMEASASQKECDQDPIVNPEPLRQLLGIPEPIGKPRKSYK